jgi:hypothetical protein
MPNAYCEGPEALLSNCGVAKKRKPCIHHQYEDIKKEDWGCLQDGLENTFTCIGFFPLGVFSIHLIFSLFIPSKIDSCCSVIMPFLSQHFLTRPTNCFSKRINS